MNNYKLRQRKMPTILKLGAIALFGACFCVPCLKYQDRIEKLPIPPILYANNINYVVDDDGFNQNIMVTDIAYNSSNSRYSAQVRQYLIDIPIYDVYLDMSVTFTINGGDITIVNNSVTFNGVSWSGFGNTNVINPDSQTSLHALYFDVFDNCSYLQYTCEYTDAHDMSLYVGSLSSNNVWITNILYDDHGAISSGLPNGLDIDVGLSINWQRLFVSGANAYANGYQNGMTYILEHLSDYNLYTQQEYLAYGASEYQRGFNASNDVLSIAGFVHEIFKAPVTMFKGIFNWTLPLPNGEVINMLPLMTFLLTIGIALAVVNLILKIK